jgi:hypothetical protein
MPGQECSSGEIKRILNDNQRTEVDQHLAAGRGVAIYEDGRGRPILLMTYGSRDADIPNQFPPSHFGGGMLSTYVPVPKKANPMRSPLMDWEGGPPQIRRPRVSPSVTSYPSVDLSMRTSSHPRGNNEYITPLLPGREPEQVQPQVLPPPAPLSADAEWWRDQLSGRS